MHDFVDSERDAVERDRALRRDETGKLGRDAKREPRHIRLVLAHGDDGQAVDVPGDDVTPELVADPERALKVDAHPWPPTAGGRHAQRLRGGVCGEPGTI